MVNWRTFKIVNVTVNPRSVIVRIDGDIYYRDGRKSTIWFPNSAPCSSYRIGDLLEVDLDEICRFFHTAEIVSDDNGRIVRRIDDGGVVRRVSSTNIITTRGSSSDIVISPGVVNAMGSSRTMELARHMSRMVDENDKEYELKIEDNTNSRFTYSLICRKQK